MAMIMRSCEPALNDIIGGLLISIPYHASQVTGQDPIDKGVFSLTGRGR